MRTNAVFFAIVLAGHSICAHNVHAQIKKSTEVGLGLTLTAGNSDTVRANTGFVAKAQDKRDKLRLGADANYGKAEGDETIQNASAFVDYRRRSDRWWFAYVAADVLHDEIAKLDYRLTVGPGIGFYFINRDVVELTVEGGTSYVREEFANGDTSDDFVALRLAEAYTNSLSKRAKIWQTLEYLPDTGDFGKYLLKFELGAEAPLTDTIALKLVFRDRFDSEPAPGVKDNDIQLISGITYKVKSATKPDIQP
ncbi:MAG: DUF481 domain-containing protein [Gammaproteobacteria bacterium]